MRDFTLSLSHGIRKFYAPLPALTGIRPCMSVNWTLWHYVTLSQIEIIEDWWENFEIGNWGMDITLKIRSRNCAVIIDDVT